MPIPAYLEITDIPGSSKVQGRENWIEVLGFNHEVFMPSDRKDGSATGTRVHKDFIVIKNFDKASPKLAQFLCNGKKIGSAILHWYQIDDMGQEKEYFKHKLENARVVSMKPYMPDVDNPSNEQYKHMEEVALRYDKITWTFCDGNVEYTDAWNEGR